MNNNDIFSFEDFLNNRSSNPKPIEKIQEPILEEKNIASTNSEEVEKIEMPVEKEIVNESNKPEPTQIITKKPIEPTPTKDNIIEKPVQHYTHTFTEQIANDENLEKIDEDGYYNIYKDKSEIFTCEIDVDGTSPDNVSARLVIEGKDYSLMFPGELSDGICSIPIKKLSMLEEGQVGKIRLEVIVEGKMFSPWENDFKVKALKKKISVDVKVNVKKIL